MKRNAVDGKPQQDIGGSFVVRDGQRVPIAEGSLAEQIDNLQKEG